MFAGIATELVWKQSINQRNIIYFTVHKFMLKNLDNKVTFIQVKVERSWIIPCVAI